ncbi:MAG: polyphosphate polymerase domain-containing protein [Deltaproteobacteria bacterium]|nr:polyphosphate polymerase domain-containing protein [Deltaproteobacteria bacterium]
MSLYIPPRYELKYILDLEQVAQVRRMLQGFCILDGHCENDARRYPIHSLYFDSPTFAFHKAKNDRQSLRYKLRVRSYGPDSPVAIAEVKRKKNEVVLKTRSVFDKGDCELSIFVLDEHSEKAHRDFLALMLRHQAEPKLLVRYEREAWVSVVNPYARVTFDYDLTFQSMDTWNLDGEFALNRPIDDPQSVRAIGSGAILELKFEEGEAPSWMKVIVQQLSLLRVGFSKYGTGVEHACLHDRGFTPGARVAVER